uniref:Uncharacterized protein n=1 Tax=Arundo donax TaxID=35708 RepID=A0A0A9U699_ARUDO
MLDAVVVPWVLDFFFCAGGFCGSSWFALLWPGSSCGLAGGSSHRVGVDVGECMVRWFMDPGHLPPSYWWFAGLPWWFPLWIGYSWLLDRFFPFRSFVFLLTLASAVLGEPCVPTIPWFGLGLGNDARLRGRSGGFLFSESYFLGSFQPCFRPCWLRRQGGVGWRLALCAGGALHRFFFFFRFLFFYLCFVLILGYFLNSWSFSSCLFVFLAARVPFALLRLLITFFPFDKF